MHNVVIPFHLDFFLFGLTTGLGLIMAIGAQNLFVLRQGLLRHHRLAVAVTATLCDIILIFLGVGGAGSVIASTPWLTEFAAWGGALFLIVVGIRSLRRALHPQPQSWAQPHVSPSASWLGTVGATLAVSLLNPHVYLDTVVFLGNLGAQLPRGKRLAFALGASCASFFWFHGLSFGASFLTPIFRHPLTARLFDAFVAAVMFAVAFYLLERVL